MTSEGKHPGGRPSKDRVRRTYTIDRKVAEYIDNLPDGNRSEFVNAVLVENIRHKPRDYIEIRLTPEQIDLQDEINEKCKGVWHPTPRETYKGIIVGVSSSTDTNFLDNLGVEYRVVLASS